MNKREAECENRWLFDVGWKQVQEVSSIRVRVVPAVRSSYCSSDKQQQQSEGFPAASSEKRLQQWKISDWQ